MDSTTLSAPEPASPVDPVPSSASAPSSPPLATGAATPGLGAEVRDSLVLLTFAVAATVGLTTAAQAALAVLS